MVAMGTVEVVSQSWLCIQQHALVMAVASLSGDVMRPLVGTPWSRWGHTWAAAAVAWSGGPRVRVAGSTLQLLRMAWATTARARGRVQCAVRPGTLCRCTAGQGLVADDAGVGEGRGQGRRSAAGHGDGAALSRPCARFREGLCNEKDRAG